MYFLQRKSYKKIIKKQYRGSFEDFDRELIFEENSENEFEKNNKKFRRKSCTCQDCGIYSKFYLKIDKTIPFIEVNFVIKILINKNLL